MKTLAKQHFHTCILKIGLMIVLFFIKGSALAQVDFKTLQKAVAKDSVKNKLPYYVGGINKFRTDFYKYAIPGPAYTEKLCASFDISVEGKISNVRFFRKGLRHGIDSAAYEKALLKTANWMPARLKNQIIAVKTFTIMIEDPNEDIAPPANYRRPAEALEPEIYTVVEQQPEPPGGTAGLRERVTTFIARPSTYKNDTTIKFCKVHLKFVVDTLGNCTEPEVLKPCKNCPELSQTALEILAKEKQWKPGVNNGKKVKVYFNLPIIFKFTD